MAYMICLQSTPYSVRYNRWGALILMQGKPSIPCDHVIYFAQKGNQLRIRSWTLEWLHVNLLNLNRTLKESRGNADQDGCIGYAKYHVNIRVLAGIGIMRIRRVLASWQALQKTPASGLPSWRGWMIHSSIWNKITSKHKEWITLGLAVESCNGQPLVEFILTKKSNIEIAGRFSSRSQNNRSLYIHTMYALSSHPTTLLLLLAWNATLAQPRPSLSAQEKCALSTWISTTVDDLDVDAP